MMFKLFELQENSITKNLKIGEKAHVLSDKDIFLLVIAFIFSLEFVQEDTALFAWYINYVTANILGLKLATKRVIRSERNQVLLNDFIIVQSF